MPRCASRREARERVRVDGADLQAILGPRRFENEVAMRTSVPGVATGLAWTPTGGDILFVEATRVPGSNKLILTGQLGDVMKESAQAALTLVKSRSAGLGIDPSVFEKSDVHVHVPAGAIPKDGPSAGVAMFLALVSLFTGRTVRSDTAMTGEISLRGLVLPIGGVKEKVLAAMQAGIETVCCPRATARTWRTCRRPRASRCASSGSTTSTTRLRRRSWSATTRARPSRGSSWAAIVTWRSRLEVRPCICEIRFAICTRDSCSNSWRSAPNRAGDAGDEKERFH